jgi:Domain of unknown function (DUF4380)
MDRRGAGGAVVPIETDGEYLFRSGGLALTVDPRRAGRVTSLVIDGKNLLTGPETNAENWGSTFWTSPQSAWGWPPPHEIESAPFAATLDGAVLTLRGPVAPMLGVSVDKRFQLDASDGSLSIRYAIHNHGPRPIKLSPWEVTRVHATGITFFPTGEASPREPLVGVREVSGITWFEYDPSALVKSQKLFADGAEGWLAHLDGGMILVKSFADVPPERQAPGEGEIEIYASADPRPPYRYVEIEQQGAYGELLPDATTAWHVRWYVKKLPAGIPARVASKGLVDYVRTLVS